MGVLYVPHVKSKRISEALEPSLGMNMTMIRRWRSRMAYAFAMRLGVDFALQINKRKCLKLHALDRFIYPNATYITNSWQQGRNQNIDTLVHVYHGPVHYEDFSGVIDTDDDFRDIGGGIKACFTKRAEFAEQSEYRFVLSTVGAPSKRTISIDISEELRELTVAV